MNQRELLKSEFITILGNDPSFLRTLPGNLPKAAALVTNTLFFICGMCAEDKCTDWMNIQLWCILLPVTGFCITAFLLAIYFKYNGKDLHRMLRIEGMFMFIWTMFYIGTSGALISAGCKSHAFIAAAFFGFVTAILNMFSVAYLCIIHDRVYRLAEANLSNRV